MEALPARDAYIRVVLHMEKFEDWIRALVKRDLTSGEFERVRKLFDAQVACQQMFTSCGWFFDDLSRIEPRNNISYAAHAAALMNQVTGTDYQEVIQPILAEAVDEKNHLTAADYYQSAYRRFSGQ
mgnify:FL=1